MPAGLFLNAAGYVGNEQGCLGLAGSGHHVLYEFPVAGVVDQDVVSMMCFKKYFSCIDCQGLFPLLLKLVCQKGQAGILSQIFGDAFRVIPFIFCKRVRVQQKPADQGGFAVVNFSDKSDSCW